MNYRYQIPGRQRTISAFFIRQRHREEKRDFFRNSEFQRTAETGKLASGMNVLAKNLLILASAGSGKTFQLGNRVIGLVARGVEPEKIVALTFTRKAAGEFADSVLTKLAEAASDGNAARKLRQTLDLPQADFKNALERVTRALPDFTLGTMDGFFSKIVRGFQYELGLTGGKFDLLEGPRAAAAVDEMLAEILGDALANEKGETFFHAFRRATLGKEDQGVLGTLRAFVTRWQSRFQESGHLQWGPADMVRVTPQDWLKKKSTLALAALNGLDDITFTRNGQRQALEKEISNLENHVIGGGSLGGKISSLMASILEAVATQSGPLVVKSYKEFTIGGSAGEALREMVELAAQCEMAAALLRTRAIREVVSVFDELCAKRLRNKGMLGFNDVKLLMGDWSRNEDARLRREAVDFRMDSRISHWLLDEFQDTSRADWTGLQPLIDEAATGEDGSLFIVGDRKQAIYAWRGGDVRLFDEVAAVYQGGLEIESMEESWRSCPEVLDLVNRVCGDSATLSELFGTAAANWQWENHFPAEPLLLPAKRGQAKVEVVGTWDERLDRLAEILMELGVGRRAMTCGILLRGNQQVRDTSDFLRAKGFDVIEEGRREPAKDNPAGLAVSHLLKWLADPSDMFSREVLEMSPLANILHSHFGDAWNAIWEASTAKITATGFAAAIGDWIRECSNNWSDFGQRRVSDLISTLADLDTRGIVSPNEAAEWLERLEISQSPGMAAVQVMTIHKSKGLGFDIVILPDIPDDVIPQIQYFDVAEGDEWLTQTPPKWARTMIPEMKRAEEIWASSQRYEAFCMLYVALTRAKRGLHVLLEPPADSANPLKPSLSNWLSRAIGSAGNPGLVLQTGEDGWSENIPALTAEKEKQSALQPVAASPLRMRISPTQRKRHAHLERNSLSGMKFGTEVHTLLENVSWMDEMRPIFPKTPAGVLIENLIRNPALMDVFSRNNRDIDLIREQPIDALTDGMILSGIIDRMHIHRNASGSVVKIEIIDFKTDALEDPGELIIRYSGQMDAYRSTVAKIYPEAEIHALLLSIHHARLIRLP